MIFRVLVTFFEGFLGCFVEELSFYGELFLIEVLILIISLSSNCGFLLGCINIISGFCYAIVASSIL
jgi:hypothetical protein